MKKTIKSLLKIEAGDIGIMMAIVSGVMIAGGVIDYFLYSGSTSETVVEVGIIMAIASYVLYELTFEGIGLGQIFNNSLAMGVTRKRLFPSYVILCIMKNTIGLLIIIVLGAAERFYCRRAFPDNVKEDVYMILFTGRGLFITISLMFLVSIIAVFVGALILRFGKKAFWPLWAVWMMAYLLPGKLGKMIDPDGEISNMLGKNVRMFLNADVFVPVWSIIFLALCGVFYLITYKVIIKKQSVTF